MLLAFNHWYLWGGLLGLLWLICLLSAGVLTWRHNHKLLFFIGFIFPILWIAGAIWDPPPKYRPGSRP